MQDSYKINASCLYILCIQIADYFGIVILPTSFLHFSLKIQLKPSKEHHEVIRLETEPQAHTETDKQTERQSENNKHPFDGTGINKYC